MPSEFSFLAPPYDAALMTALLALNNAHAEELSYKTEEGFADLLARASFVRAVEGGRALLVGFDETCDYDNDNFRWLKARFPRFNYIDRVVVSGAARGQGLARQLYGLIAEATRKDGRERLVCEINLEPPNPASDKFHEALGFKPIGQRQLAGSAKIVRYWARELNG
ncbi:MAG: GNAT family N-acetyltransferase [Proteobacteria bacterium]|nr:GNAT family N-acetyltransferase [Pseudomonadota bacterium]